MKNKYIALGLMLAGLMSSCKGNQDCFAPDGIYPAKDGEGIYVANRGGNELLLFNGDYTTAERKASFDSPVTDLTFMPDGRMWVVCDGYAGKMYEVDADAMEPLSETKIGNSPSAVRYSPCSKSLWVTQRYGNSLLEVNPDRKDVLSSVEIGREPVDMELFASDSLLLVVNNLPEMSALDFPVAAQLSVVDVLTKEVVKRIMLPNGSTDAKSVAVSRGGSYAYVTHLLARYQLPTNQVDRGWMYTNALSVIDLQNKELLNTVLLDTPQKGTANPWEVTLSSDNRYVIVAAAGVDELAMIDRTELHKRFNDAKQGWFKSPSTGSWENIPNDAGFLHGIVEYVPTDGKGPRAVATAGAKAIAANYFTGEIVEMDIASREKHVYPSSRPALSSTLEGSGNMYFHDATLCFQGWQSCASCHPNDARVDGLNWDLMNDGMGNSKSTKSLLYSHQTSPCMVTGIRKDAETAVRSGIKYILFAAENEDISKAMDAYLMSLSAEPSPYLVDNELSDAAQRGKVHFDQHCASCHSGSYYTDGKLYDVDWATGSEKGKKMDVPALTEVWRTGPYLYDGRAASMRDMLETHGPRQPLTQQELDDLSEYILSL